MSVISKALVEQAVGLSEIHNSAGFAVVPHTNTLLANLCLAFKRETRKYNHDTIANLTSNTVYDEVFNDLMTATSMSLNDLNEGAVNEFCAAFDVSIEESKKRLTGMIYVLRNHVNPLIRDMYEGVNELLNSAHGRLATQFEVEVLYDPEIFKSASFMAGVETYVDVEPEPIVAGCFIPPQDLDDLTERLKTGVSDADEAIATWCQANPKALTTVFNRVFLAVEHQDASDYDIYSVVNELMRCPRSGVMNSVVIYLLANSFFKDIPDGVVSPPGEFKERLVLLRKVSGGYIARGAKLFNVKLESETVVSTYTENGCTVFPWTYAQFIEQGGSNEVLLGAMYSQNRPYSINALLEGQAEFKKAYYQQLSLLESKDRNNIARRRREAAGHLFSKQLLNMASTDENVTSSRINELRAEFNKQYSALTNEDLDDFLVASIKLICRTRFANQPFEEILLDSRRIAAVNKNLEIDDVMTLAFVEYIGKWIASMLKLTNKAF